MLRTLALLTLVVPALPAWAPAPTDNVLILVADDMGVDSTPAYLEGPVSMGRTMRNDRYKLLKYTDPLDNLNLKFELYDLPNDPFEQTDLLQNGVGGLTPDEADAFGELRDALGALVGP